MKKRIFIIIVLIIILSFSFTYAADIKLVSTLNKSLENIKSWIIKLSTPAAAVAVGTGVFMKKFSFGDEERIVMREKTNKKFSILIWIYSSYRFNTKSHSNIGRCLGVFMEEEVVTQTINVTDAILETINSLCDSLFSSINKSIFPELDKLIFLDSELIESTYVERIVGTNFNTGLLVLAEFFLSAFILYYAIKRFTAFYTGSEIESASKFFVRAIVIGIIVSYSFAICSGILEFTNGITEFICLLGKSIFHQQISFASLVEKLYSTSSNGKFNIFSFNGIITSMISISSFSLILSFSARYIFAKVLVLLSPFSFLCLINKCSFGIFRCWLKCLFSLLLIQIVMSLILLLSFALMKEGTTTIFNQILLIGTTISLMKSSQFVKEFINNTGISTDFSAGVSGIKSLFMR